MKIFTWIVAIFFVIVAVVYSLLFTGFGNNLLKPSIEKIVSEKISMDFKLDKFQLKFSSFDISANINKEVLLNTQGTYSLFKTSFDLVYNTKADTFMNIPIKLNLNGKAGGKFNNFKADSKGSLTGSNLLLDARIKDYNLAQLTLDTKDLDLESLSIIAMQKAYLSGKLNATANILDFKGKANINAPKVLITQLAQNDFNITLPQNFSINLNSDIDINKNIFSAVTAIITPIAKANATKTTFDLDKNELTSDLNLQIDNLAKLEPIIKQKLSGSIKAKANTKILNSKVDFLDATIEGLGGEVIASLKNNTLETNIKSLKLAEILNLAGMNAIAKSDINGQAKISNIYDMKNIQGVANLTLDNGILDYKKVNEMLNTDLKENVKFTLKNNINIANEILDFNSILTSAIIQNFNANGKYMLTKNSAQADFVAKIENLSKIFGSKIKGGADIKANVDIKDNNINIANVDFTGFGGSINAKVDNQTLQTNIKNIELSNAFGFTSMDALFTGVLNGNLKLNNLDFKNLNGDGNFAISNGVFNSNALSKLLGATFPKNVKFNANFKPTIKNSIANFTSNFTSDLGQISKFDGSYNINTNVLDSAYNLKINDLSKLSFLTGVVLYTPLNVNGKLISKNDTITASALSDIFSSDTNITLVKNTLNADIKNAKIEQILTSLGYSAFYIGDTNAKLNYSIDKASGTFQADILKAQLAKSELTTLISSVLAKDITTQVYENGRVVGTIKDNLLNFNANLHSNKSDINVTKAQINTKTTKINIPVKANIEKTDIAIDITGTTQKPKYSLSSDYLKQKAKEGLGKIFNKQEAAKDLIKGLQKLF